MDNSQAYPTKQQWAIVISNNG